MQFDPKYIHWSAKGEVMEVRTWRNESFFKERKVASGVSWKLCGSYFRRSYK